MSDKAQVALVNMPFSSSKYPSIQLGTLSALLKSKGVPVDCHHLNVRFARLPVNRESDGCVMSPRGSR